MKPKEVQPLSRSIRVVRWIYYASMAVGFPLWLLVAFIHFAWVWFALWPIPDNETIEFQSPSAKQTAVLSAAAMMFFVVYLVSLFWAYRITRQPWVLFASMLLPVLTFCYAVVQFPIADSNLEKLFWLAYLGTLGCLLAAGMLAASIAERHQTDTPQVCS